MKCFYSFFVVWSVFLGAKAQEREILGRLIDSETQKAVENANVIVPGTLLGTISNVAGFFKLMVQQNHKSLTVSKIGYKTSNISIENVDRFQVKIERGVLELQPLDLVFFDANKLDTQNDTAQYAIAPNQTERDAQYSSGWRQFYEDINKILNREDVLRIVNDSLLSIHFTIENSGAFSFTGTKPQKPLVNGLMNRSAAVFLKWNAAQQNGIAVPQYFALPIRATEVFAPVEETAFPVGGMPAFYKFVAGRMRYPALARRMGVEGKVFVEFIIEQDGTITNPRIIKGIGADCDEEALRVISICPKWNPGKQKGKPVKQRYTLPIIFKLG